MTKLNNTIHRALAVDLGASNGRAMLGEYDGERVGLSEVYRFPNEPVELNGTLYWDFPRLFHEVKQSLLRLRAQGSVPQTMGIDTWGVDFGLLDTDGYLLDNPWHYRNTMGSGARDAVLAKMPPKQLFARTGIAIPEFNTLFQLHHIKQKRPALLERAERLLFIPDLFNWFLTGRECCEYTAATTSQLLNVATRGWDEAVLELLGISPGLFAQIVQPGRYAAPLLPALQRELDLPPVDVVSVASHDTHAAFMAVPADSGAAMISCGTWAMVGREVPMPIVNDEALNAGYSNEGTLEGRYNFVSSLTGLWLVQECRRQWALEGDTSGFAQQAEMALAAQPFACLLDIDAEIFVAPGNMPARICGYAQKSTQTQPRTIGATVRAIIESLALKFRYALERQDRLCGKRAERIYIIGGGAKDALLCQFTANATGRPVVTGPNEATALGNVLSQLFYTGAFQSLAQARACVARSYHGKEYMPQDTAAWDAQYSRYLKLLGQ